MRGRVVRFLVIFLSIFSPSAHSSQEGEIIGGWAETFGEELLRLGQSITKVNDIKARYKALNARVEQKDGPKLLKSAVETVGRMMARKMDAVRCILDVAETIAEQFDLNMTSPNFTYFSSKYSPTLEEPENTPTLPETIRGNAIHYRNMSLNPDTHFYNIPVNTQYSSVHVPTNIYDKEPEALEAILWSEALDEVFTRNYNSDPALSWQYFGSSTGVMRQYPAMQWDPTWSDEPVDLFDCRTRSWYIEATTCSKDVVILFDNSGSMTGYRNFIAKVTVMTILKTFSNNDFLNIFSFTNDTIETVPCFEDTLVQATPENLRTFNEAVGKLKPDGNSNLTIAFTKAFDLLEKYRINRECKNEIVGCNQAIMLITDGVPGNMTEIFDKYNRLDNGSYIPVRIFTYLIGKEVTNVREIQWMACLNRGYYAHIQSIDEVQMKVLNYIQVIARPLVLQKDNHPASWTHAYADITYDEDADDHYNEEYRLMTSVAIPAFDHKVNKDNSSRTAALLGVAATDVPIDEIERLTLPYKLGVNGYSFIVSNNGYLLLHPDLRPVYKGILKENYNSIDMVEVEMVDDGRGARELGPELLALRNALVSHEEGSMLDIPIRYHYDKMRRVSRERQDYFYAQLPQTPFSLGLALPHDYGNTWIKAGDEIKRNQHMGMKITDFFFGDNWKVHPKWVYCKYHYLEGHEFDTPESELLHFLKKLDMPDWKWSEQYEYDPQADKEDFERIYDCGRKTYGDDAYYCNKELVQLLVFDAKVTDPSYKSWQFKDEEEQRLLVRYNASLRFVATMSGLTRWQFVLGEELDNMTEFGDYHAQAIDETWYKSAILQHQIDPDSFVFSVPFDSAYEDESVLVTASHAVFPRDGGLEAAASVVGFQFSHARLFKRFMEITSDTSCPDCLKPCSAEEMDCYVIDNNGYVILSEERNDTGRFFGEVEGAVMESMINSGVFQNVTVFDLQALCFHEVLVSRGSNLFITPFRIIKSIIDWFVLKLLWMAVEINLHQVLEPYIAFSLPQDEVETEYNYEYDADDEVARTLVEGSAPTAKTRSKKLRKGYNEEEEEYFTRPRLPVYETQSYPCDQETDLFVLQQQLFIHTDGFMSETAKECSRPYFIKRIPYSNLVLVAVNSMRPTCYRRVSGSARAAAGAPLGPAQPCHKLNLSYLPRTPLEGCYTDHPLEHEIETCGRGGRIDLSLSLLLRLLLINCIFNIFIIF